MKIVVIAALLISATSSHAQPYRALLLPQALQMEGIVVDLEGNPIPDASIDHSDDQLHAHRTDASGRFNLVTRAPAVVIRKQGLQSEYLRTQDRTDVKITLRKSDTTRSFPLCPKGGGYVGLGGWLTTLQFHLVQGVKASPPGHDIDYVARSYYINTRFGKKGIRHGGGPMWGGGVPSDVDVWGSVQYQETTYKFGDFTITDARDQLSDGTRWRSLGKFSESASYSGADETTARILDKVVDGACSRPISPPSVSYAPVK